MVCLDNTNIYPGDDFLEEMKKGIRAADKIIICLSPSFNKKPPVSWVKRELKMAILKEGETGKGIIIPVEKNQDMENLPKSGKFCKTENIAKMI